MTSKHLKNERQKYRSRYRKYRKGAPILSVYDLLLELAAGRFVMWRGRPLHPEFCRSMSLRAIERGILAGSICRAEKPCDEAPMALPFDREFVEAMQR